APLHARGAQHPAPPADRQHGQPRARGRGPRSGGAGVKLEGKVALVTGAGRGIGRGISIAFGEQGASVVLASRTESSLQEASRLVEETGAQVLPIVCDVGDPAQVERTVSEAAKAFGRLDILLNNAQSWGAPEEKAIGTPIVVPEELPLEWFDHTFRTGV